MTKRRTARARTPKAKPPPVRKPPRLDPAFSLDVAELLELWPRLFQALASDSGSPGSGRGRSATGGAKESPAVLNSEVFDAAALIETGLSDIEAQVRRVLSLKDRALPTFGTLACLPAWHFWLRGKPGAGPLAEQIEQDVQRWSRWARRAIGLISRDVRLPVRCPHHREDAPTFLLAEGAEAALNKTFLQGPPTSPPSASPPARSDWRWSGGQWVWTGTVSGPAYTFTDQRVIRCPHCKMVWQGKARRLLARQLRALGDDISRDVAEDLIG